MGDMIFIKPQMARISRILFCQQDKTDDTDGKSLRPCLSAAPSACLAHADYIFMAHAETAESADFASRYALAASGMYTLGETPTAVSDSDAAHSVKVCEVCVRQKNQSETK